MKKKIGIAAALFLLILPELPCMAHGAGASVSSAAVGVRANVCLYQELILGVTGTALSGRPQAESVQKIYGVYPSGSFVAAIGADIPEGWEAVIWESEAEIPDWGIEIRAEGKENARIMVTGQHGTLNAAQFYPEQPDPFVTEQGREGLYYKGEYESEGERFVDQQIVFGQLDSGFYGISIQMPKAVFEENQETILEMLRSVEIMEKKN
ncbi:MAG TPA: hypothetical protein H9831_02970 [Candidatus Eisenbergiella pullistercoris]|uniref:Uncharacterized protein n=1 Tax=Candidatus Eisenbergiella pullistercoris TaxID=2838555 RepID=A0A9D2C666_9FIRM|nr:hypothetical protein [Candidatus Eisenbergiella pullistercoris]